MRITLLLSFVLALPAVAGDKAAIHETFAELLSIAIDKKLDAVAHDQGVPVALAELIKVRYPQANNHENLLKEYRACALEFDARWKSVTERSALVDEAVTKAQALKADKKLDDAMKLLEAVVTSAEAPPVDHLGRSKPVKRDFLEVRDAELPAVTLYAALAAEQRQIERLPQVRADLLARRRVSKAEPTERLGYLAYHCGKKSKQRFYGFSVGQKGEATKAMETVLGYADRAQQDGASLASGFFRSLDTYGVNVVEVGGNTETKKGEWVLMELAPNSASKKQIAYSKKDTWKESFNCKQTEQIIGIDPVTGDFKYKWNCETRTKKSLVTLKASLAKAPPEMKKKGGKFEKVWLLGKLKKAGPKWALEKAQVIELADSDDLKFLQPGFR